MITATHATCPNCAGWGATGEPGSFLTCQVCSGTGVWLVDDSGHTFTYPFDTLVHPHSAQHFLLTKILRYTLVLGSVTLALACFAIILSQATTFTDVLWQGGWPHVGFGLAGLGSMAAFATFEKRRGSEKNLHNLSPDQNADLSDYAHSRLGELINEAGLIALSLHDDIITDSTFLAALIAHPRTQSMVARLEHVPDDVIDASKTFLAQGTAQHPTSVRIHLTAFQKALSNDFPYADLEDLLLVYSEDATWSKALFKQFDLNPKTVLSITKWYAEDSERMRRWAFWKERGRVKPKGFMNKAWTALPTPFLDQYSRDLTSLAAQGALEGSDTHKEYVQRSLEILGNPTNHNLLLVGEAGVGKTGVLSAIAFKMVAEEVPEALRDHRLIEVDIAALPSSGEAQEHVQKMLEEVQLAGNVILAIPEIQSLVASNQGPLDAAAVLASSLKQGIIQVISTATYADFHRYVEQNALLTSLLTVVEIKPPSVEETVTILEEQSARIEAREQVYFTYPAIEAAATLAERFLTGQVLPQSAITLMGEAASAVHNNKKHWVQASDIQASVEKRTGVPIQATTQEEGERLLNLENELHSRIVGQEQAVSAVSNALRRARAGLHSGDRPIATFLFVGPTGVGKTEMAKAVANLYFGNEESFTRLDMSEYQNGTSVYRLIGPPATNTESFTEGGDLTQPIREHPFSLILLDEIEKAHPDVLNLFLQLLDDGRLTENTGRTVQFRNTIVVATSNAGSQEISRLIGEGIKPDELPKQMLSLLTQSFKPEFLNRFDAIIPFSPLTQNEAQSVTTLLLQAVIATAAEQNITLTFTDDAIVYLTEVGYDPQMGGRPLRRVIQDKVEALLAKRILSGETPKGSSLEISGDMLH
jgi:ATP-dependent Clp protease ATP-binding subunit ClpC